MSNYASIKTADIANRNPVFVSLSGLADAGDGCKGCFNEKAGPFDYGKPFDDVALAKIEGELKKEWIFGSAILRSASHLSLRTWKL